MIVKCFIVTFSLRVSNFNFSLEKFPRYVIKLYDISPPFDPIVTISKLLTYFFCLLNLCIISKSAMYLLYFTLYSAILLKDLTIYYMDYIYYLLMQSEPISLCK